MDRRFLVLALGVLATITVVSTASASAIAISNVTVSNLSVTADTGSVTTDPFTTQVIAATQNSLGETDANTDGTPNDPALATAGVTWAAALSTASGSTWSALTFVDIPGATTGVAISLAETLYSTTFSISCGSITCSSGTDVNFGAIVGPGLLALTDPFGTFAAAQGAFSLLVNGTTALSWSQLLFVGPNDTQSYNTPAQLSNSLFLLYDTPYTLTLTVDAESVGVNSVPEPATLSLILLAGAGAIHRYRGRGRMDRV